MAFIRNTDKFVEGASNKFFTDGRAQLALQPTVTSLESEDSGMKLRLDVIEGGAGVSGSIAKAQADAQSYADQQIAALVNSAPEVLDTLKELSDAIGGDASFASTVAGQIGAVDAKVDQEILDRQAAISLLQSEMGADVSALESADSALSLRLDQLELDPVTKSYVDSQDSSLQSSINSESSARQSADSALSGRLDVIEGVGEGSVAKAEQDAKDYADGLDSAMDARMLVLEADPTTKTYVDTQDSSLQSQITQEISDRQADVDAEEQRALAAEGLLSGRLDTLELDPVTKTYVDGEVSDLQGQITQEISDRQSAVSSEQSARQSADSALSGRLDTLEADPTTKTYVDSQDSGLQSQIDTEKGRIDAILSASEADKDSFAEIVSLINSVDTENDSAFASYVLSNDAALAQEVSDRQFEDSALSGRLDVLETDPVTKSYVDSLDSAMDSRMDVLEADPTTKTYVDSEVDSLEAEDLTMVKLDGSRAMTGQLQVNSSVLANEYLVQNQGTNNLFLGRSKPSGLTTGNNLVGMGEGALGAASNTIGSVAIGPDAGRNAFGSYNTFLGFEAGKQKNSLPGGGTNVVAIGSKAAHSIRWANNTVAIGANALENVFNNSENIGIGTDSLKMCGAGAKNIAIGFTAGDAITSGSNNVIIGDIAGVATMSDTVIVAAGSTERFRVDSSGNMGIGTTNPSEKLEVAGGMKFSGAFIVKSVHSQTGTNDVISVSSSDFYVGVNCLSAEKTVQLPAPVAGKKIIVKDESGNAESNNITVEYPSGNIDGLAEFKLTANYESACFISDGSNWFVI